MGKQKETPESLYKFFQELDAGEDEETEMEVSYASSSVVRRGREASRMLMAVQQILNLKAQPAAAPSGGGEASEALQQELEEAHSEVDRLLITNTEQNKQVEELTETNERLKEKIGVMQRQIERLYNKREMSKTLTTIEGKKKTAVEAMSEEGDGDDPKGDEEVSEMKQFVQDLDTESAARVDPDADED